MKLTNGLRPFFQAAYIMVGVILPAAFAAGLIALAVYGLKIFVGWLQTH